ncbi:MAG: AMP-binding protein [Desulfobacterales bacterium]|nr:MAG: AMP-binding protein [Desulfobacterales bacterium]
MMSELDTYPKYLIRNNQIWGSEVAIRRKRFGIWQTYTWHDFYQQAKLAGLGLLATGLKPGEKVAIIGDDEPEGMWAECAVQAVGGIVVALWSDSIASEAAYIINHSDAEYALAEDQEQVDKLLEIKSEIPKVKKIIYWDPKGMRKYDDPLLLSFESLKEIGADYERSHQGIFEQLIAERNGDDIAVLCYTSGTTSLPKGAMITSKAIIHSAKTMHEFVDLKLGDDVFSTFAAASIFHHWFLGFLYLKGVIINMPEEPETIMQDYREIAPKFMLLAPRQWQSLVSNTQIRVNDGGFLKRSVYGVFLNIGYRMVAYHAACRKPPVHWKLLYKLGESLVYRPLRDKLGLTNTRYPATGSAFLSPDFFKFFHAIGLNLIQCYGSTEAGFVSSHQQHDINVDSVGCAGCDVKVQVTDDQEILVGGGGIFCGYYKDECQTAEVMKDGWFYTGDAAYIDQNEHIYYQDRIKNLEELSSGYKYAPAYIEGKLQFSKYITDAMLVGGSNRDYTSAVIAINFDTIGKWAEENHIPYTTFVALSQMKEVGELIKEDIRGVNKTIPEETRLRKFVLLHKEFDPDDAELTRTRKLRRSFLQDRYKDLIDAIYNDVEEMPVEADVKYRDGRTGKVKTNIRIWTVD